MSNQEFVRDQTICQRREPRYRTKDPSLLQCETTVAQAALRRGAVVDLSTTGIRLLCEGQFEVGQEIFAELTTNRSHGIYRGVVRRVQPWVGGQSVLGCSLSEPIPETVLQDLANEDVVNRRTDDRVQLDQVAKLSWPLRIGEHDVELKDLSSGGMKIASPVAIPDDVRLRFRMAIGREEVVVEAKSIWKEECEEGCIAGVAFTQTDASKQVARILEIPSDAIDTVTAPDDDDSSRLNAFVARVREFGRLGVDKFKRFVSRSKPTTN